MKIVIIYNAKRERSVEFTSTLSQYLYDHGAEVMPCYDKPGFSIEDLDGVDFSSCDAGIVLGGDGTLLAAVRALSVFDIPLFGVNMGRVGFLSSTEADDALAAVDKLLAGKYIIRERLMIKAALIRQGREKSVFTAFNDFVVSSGEYSRAITFDLSIASQAIDSYNADGVIVSTPTGSTGYSLSAGGPILMDDMDITLITPICPHTFFSRPIVASAGSEIDIVFKSDSHTAFLTADGQFRVTLAQNDLVSISAADKKAKIIQFGPDDYFARIKKKIYRKGEN